MINYPAQVRNGGGFRNKRVCYRCNRGQNPVYAGANAYGRLRLLEEPGHRQHVFTHAGILREFRWFVVGEHRMTARLATVTADGRLRRRKDGEK